MGIGDFLWGMVKEAGKNLVTRAENWKKIQAEFERYSDQQLKAIVQSDDESSIRKQVASAVYKQRHGIE